MNGSNVELGFLADLFLKTRQPLAGTGTKMTRSDSDSIHHDHQSRPQPIHDHEPPLLVAAMAHAATSTTKGIHTADDAHQVACTGARWPLPSE